MNLRRHLHRRRLLHPVFFGTLRHTRPVSRRWGFDRGLPIDRYYIERFLAEHRADIHGSVLEVYDNAYTRRFGVDVRGSDVLDIDATNPRASIVADLARATTVADDAFDCFVLTQTLQLVFDCRAAVAETYRILRPGGVVLATVPGITRTIPRDEAPVDYWRFTPDSCRRVFAEVFGQESIEVKAFGNVLAAVAFLEGIAAEELRPRELDVLDESYPVVVAVRAVKA